jgi:uncharacterized protein (TIGR02996 family)
MNFKLFIEGVGKTIQYELRGEAAQELLARLAEYAGEERPGTHVRVLTPRDEFVRWLRSNMIRERSKIILSLPITIGSYGMISQLLDFILFMEDYPVFYHDYHPMMTDVMEIHKKLHEPRLFLISMVEKATPEWKQRLKQTLNHQPDDNLWLVYADYLEERGDRNGEEIRRIFS